MAKLQNKKLQQLLDAYSVAEEEQKEALERLQKATALRRACDEEVENCRKLIEEFMTKEKIEHFTGNEKEVAFSKKSSLVYDEPKIIAYAKKEGLEADILEVKVRRSVVKECLDLGFDVPGVTSEEKPVLVISQIKKDTNWEGLK
jgi:hypothetical protein